MVCELFGEKKKKRKEYDNTCYVFSLKGTYLQNNEIYTIDVGQREKKAKKQIKAMRERANKLTNKHKFIYLNGVNKCVILEASKNVRHVRNSKRERERNIKCEKIRQIWACKNLVQLIH